METLYGAGRRAETSLVLPISAIGVWSWWTQTLTGRLLGLVTLIVSLAVGLLTVVELKAEHEEVLQSEQQRLVIGANALAAGLDGDLLLAAEQDLTEEDAIRDWSAHTALAGEQRKLARFVDQMGITTDIYTLSLDPLAVSRIVDAPEDVHPEAMRFGLTSGPQPYWHHRYAYRPEMAPTLLWGREASTRVYEDEHGTWISAYAPVRSRDGQVVALVEMDAPLSQVRSRVLSRVLWGLMVMVGMLVVVLGAIGAVSRRTTRSVWQLVEAAERFGRGDHQNPIPVEGPLEVSALGHALEAARQDLREQQVQQSRNAAALTEALRVAREAGATRGEFLATVSHELRTPMNGVMGAVELLSRMPMSPEQRELVVLIRESGHHMVGLVDDVLDFARLDMDTVALRESIFHPSRIAQTALGKISQEAAEKGVSCTTAAGVGVPETVLGRAERLSMVLDHLLSNALKFTAVGHIRLEVRLLDARTLRYAVVDTGIGIAPEHQTRIFEPFTQADGSMSRRYGGSGLGLSICQRLVRLMGGTIGVESAPGQGSTFWFTLPIQPLTMEDPEETLLTESRRRHRTIRPEEALPAPRVLVAEDHPINQKIVVRLLEGLGCTCDVVEDGEKALAMAAQRAYSLVLMDCQMPNMDGLQATIAIRQLSAPWSEVPIVALTANAMEGDRDRCLAAGMDDYLQKPVSSERLAETVDCWRQRRSA